MDTAALIAQNAQRWRVAKYDPTRGFSVVAQRLVAGKARYQAVSVVTGVPWWVIAVIHEREASQRWDRSIAQGDPWNAVSVHVPRGRGPFKSWFDAAVDALEKCAPYAAAWKDWTAGGTLTLLELYNGEGYEKFHHMASPYLWGGSDQYVKGKYVSDEKFDPEAVDKQLGCAGMLDAMRKLDPSIRFADEQMQSPSIVPPPPSPQPTPTPQPQSGWLSVLVSAFLAILKSFTKGK
jgi:lysozyme family protein